MKVDMDMFSFTLTSFGRSDRSTEETLLPHEMYRKQERKPGTKLVQANSRLSRTEPRGPGMPETGKQTQSWGEEVKHGRCNRRGECRMLEMEQNYLVKIM